MRNETVSFKTEKSTKREIEKLGEKKTWSFSTTCNELVKFGLKMGRFNK